MSVSMSSFCSSDDSESPQFTHAQSDVKRTLTSAVEKEDVKQKIHEDDDVQSETSSNDTEVEMTYSNMAENQPPMKAVKFAMENLVLHCRWSDCDLETAFLPDFTEHVISHAKQPDLEVVQTDDKAFSSLLTCRWGNCSYRVDTFQAFARHVYIHIYHTKLKSLGDNCIRRFQGDGPPLVCPGDSRLVYAVPVPTTDFRCAWDACCDVHINIQEYYDHVRYHCLENPKGKNVPGGIKCKWKGCTGSYQNVTKLLDHIKSHTQEKLNACPTCGSLFSTRTRLIDHCHRQKDKERKEKVHPCGLCFKEFGSGRLLRDHIRTHINNYRCSKCAMSCVSPSALKSHMIYRHSEYTSHPCPHCTYSGKTKRDLSRHVALHLMPPLVCSVGGCQFQARTERGLETHRSKRHNNLKQGVNNYCCHLCDRQYSRGNSLTKHLISVHNLHWPSGHVRFRYQLQADGSYSLLTVRYESEVVITARTEDGEEAVENPESMA